MHNHDHDDELAQLSILRDQADRQYNNALTALDRATTPPLDLPQLTDGFDDRLIPQLNESWRLLPDKAIDLGTGWRRRLRGIAWRLVGPFLQRQQQLNALLVEHINLNVEGRGKGLASRVAFVDALDRHLKSLASFQGQLMHYLQQITLYVDTRDRHVAGQSPSRSAVDALSAVLRTVSEDFRERIESVEVHVSRSDKTREELDGLTRALSSRLTAVSEEFHKKLETGQIRLHRTAKNIEELDDRTRTLHQSTERIGADLKETTERIGADLKETTERIGADLKELAESACALRDTVEEHAAERQGLRQSVELVTAATHTLKREIERLRNASLPPTDPEAAVPATTSDLEAYKYLCFESAFRGPREEIAARQREYLPYFKGASDVLDLGCGRGEFLALLREHGITARGLDANAEMVEHCREQDLDVTHGDALQYLRGVTDESLGGLFSAQVVEHLEADYLTLMLAEAQRVLRPGSRIVLETLNPVCWAAFFSAFVRDITHRHPLHPDTLGYFLRASGFVEVEIVYRSPVPEEARLEQATVDTTLADTPVGSAVCALTRMFNQHVDRLNGLIFAEQDYAAIAKRP